MSRMNIKSVRDWCDTDLEAFYNNDCRQGRNKSIGPLPNNGVSCSNNATSCMLTPPPNIVAGPSHTN